MSDMVVCGISCYHSHVQTSTHTRAKWMKKAKDPRAPIKKNSRVLRKRRRKNNTQPATKPNWERKRNIQTDINNISVPARIYVFIFIFMKSVLKLYMLFSVWLFLCFASFISIFTWIRMGCLCFVRLTLFLAVLFYFFFYLRVCVFIFGFVSMRLLHCAIHSLYSFSSSVLAVSVSHSLSKLADFEIYLQTYKFMITPNPA